MIRSLSGPRLDMRPLADGDEALYVRLYTDPQVMARIAPPQDPGTAARGFRLALALNAAAAPVRLFWVIQERVPAHDLGLLGLTLDGDGSGEVGVVLPAVHQGRGIASEAIAALADHAFATMGLRRLHTRHEDGHGLAAGLMAALGFERSGTAADSAGWRWQLTPARWAAWPRRQPDGNPLP